jgi:hypothetical protein
MFFKTLGTFCQTALHRSCTVRLCFYTSLRFFPTLGRFCVAVEFMYWDGLIRAVLLGDLSACIAWNGWEERKQFFEFQFLFFETGSYYVAQTGLEISVSPQPPECWVYRYAFHTCLRKLFFFSWYWSLNSGLCAYEAGALSLEPHLQPENFFLQYWSLNSGPIPWATLPALFLWWSFSG